jgi:hypothetical protein
MADLAEPAVKIRKRYAEGLAGFFLIPVVLVYNRQYMLVGKFDKILGAFIS